MDKPIPVYVPVMPEGWWPDQGIFVMAKNGNDELCFTITPDAYFKELYKYQMEPSLKVLLKALYQCQFITKEERVKLGLEPDLSGETAISKEIN